MEAFCYSGDSLVDVIDDAALLSEFLLSVSARRPGCLKLIAKIVVGLLEIFANAGLATESLADHEAEGSR